MPRIIDYDRVLQEMAADGMRSLYYNSGAFGFAADQTVHTRGWIGPADDSIRPAARPLIRSISPPYEPSLAALATRAWREHLAGDVWVLPMSHWAYELDFGSAGWMPDALRGIRVDPAALQPLTTGNALEFASSDATAFISFLEQLLRHLQTSDFALMFPGRPVRCTVHHHKQLWWQSPSDELMAALDRLVPSAPPADS